VLFSLESTREGMLLKWKLKKLGYDLDEERLNKLFNDFKKLTDVKKNVTTADLESLIIESAAKSRGRGICA